MQGYGRGWEAVRRFLIAIIRRADKGAKMLVVRVATVLTDDVARELR